MFVLVAFSARLAQFTCDSLSENCSCYQISQPSKMATFSGMPQWIETAKRKVVQSEEWMSFSKELFDLVTVYIEETGVSSFEHLSDDEKKVLVTRAQNALKDKSVSGNLLATLSTNLDKHFCEELNEATVNKGKNRKVDSITDKCHHAVEAILIRRPDMRVHFAQSLNATLTPRLRNLMWSRMLQNPAVKKEYLQLAETSPKKLVSKFDFEIAQKCQLVMESDPTLKPFRHFKAAVPVMRHLLSYHQVRSKSETGLTDTEYLVAIPFVYCCLSHTDRHGEEKVSKPKQVTADELAKLVEQFELFWNTRPIYTRFVGTGVSFKAFVEKVQAILSRIDPDLSRALGDLFSGERYSSYSIATKAITDLLQPCVRSLYVSYLSLNVVVYVYDQIIIGHGVENYDPLPFISAVLLHLVGKKLRSAQSWRQAENLFRSELKDVKVETIREIMNGKKLVTEIRYPIAQKLSSDKRRFPLPAAIFDDLPPWKHWYSDKIVSHFKPLLSKESSNQGSIKPSNTDLESQSQEGTSLLEVKAERDNLIEEINLMKLELEDARRKMVESEVAKLEVEKEADAEIEKLMQRIAYLQKANVLSPPPLLINPSMFGLTDPEFESHETSSTTGLVPPPNTADDADEQKEEIPPERVSALSVREEPSPAMEVHSEEPEPPKPPSPGMKPKLIFNDVIARLMQGVHELAHGTTTEREELDSQTKADLVVITKAYEQAKVDVLGKRLADDEIENLPADKRKDLSNRISKATRARLLKMKFGKS